MPAVHSRAPWRPADLSGPGHARDQPRDHATFRRDHIFSNYLSTVSSAWAAKVGEGRSLTWPAGIGGEGNPGVTTAIERTRYSIGYVERSYTTGTSLHYAAIANRDGDYTTPTPAAISADAAGKPAISVNDFSIVNEPGAAAYPICGYSWVLIAARSPAPAELP